MSQDKSLDSWSFSRFTNHIKCIAVSVFHDDSNSAMDVHCSTMQKQPTLPTIKASTTDLSLSHILEEPFSRTFNILILESWNSLITVKKIPVMCAARWFSGSLKCFIKKAGEVNFQLSCLQTWSTEEPVNLISQHQTKTQIGIHFGRVQSHFLQAPISVCFSQVELNKKSNFDETGVVRSLGTTSWMAVIYLFFSNKTKKEWSDQEEFAHQWCF